MSAREREARKAREEAVALALKTYEEAGAPARRVRDEAVARAEKAYDEVMAQARKEVEDHG